MKKYYATNVFVSDGTTDIYTLKFTDGVISRSYITVSTTEGELKFDVIADNVIRLREIPERGVNIYVIRTTPIDQPMVVFRDLTNINAYSLNTIARQLLHVVQEQQDRVMEISEHSDNNLVLIEGLDVRISYLEEEWKDYPKLIQDKIKEINQAISIVNGQVVIVNEALDRIDIELMALTEEFNRLSDRLWSSITSAQDALKRQLDNWLINAEGEIERWLNLTEGDVRKLIAELEDKWRQVDSLIKYIRTQVSLAEDSMISAGIYADSAESSAKRAEEILEEINKLVSSDNYLTKQDLAEDMNSPDGKVATMKQVREAGQLPKPTDSWLIPRSTSTADGYQFVLSPKASVDEWLNIGKRVGEATDPLVHVGAYGLGASAYGSRGGKYGGVYPSEVTNTSRTQITVSAYGGEDQEITHSPRPAEYAGIAISRNTRPIEIGVTGRGAGAELWFRAFSSPLSNRTEWTQAYSTFNTFVDANGYLRTSNEAYDTITTSHVTNSVGNSADLVASQRLTTNLSNNAFLEITSLGYRVDALENSPAGGNPQIDWNNPILITNISIGNKGSYTFTESGLLVMYPNGTLDYRNKQWLEAYIGKLKWFSLDTRPNQVTADIKIGDNHRIIIPIQQGDILSYDGGGSGTGGFAYVQIQIFAWN